MTAVIIILISLTLLFFIITYICFYMTFYVTKKQKTPKKYSLPPGKEYLPFKDTMINFMKETETLPFTPCEITSFDGLKLKGKYYEYKKGAEIELMLHGYRGSKERDLCGGVQRCFKLKRNTLIVDLRASGESEGRVISFGINEYRDCIDWVNYIINNIDKDAKIILTGISMGASTVLMAAGKPLPTNVIGVVADCGYTTAKDIIKKVVKQLKLPPNIVYPFIKISAKLYGGFNLEEYSALEGCKNAKLPIIFFHGEKDGFVPCEMSRQNYEACVSKKVLYTVKEADHGLCYLVDNDGYFKTINDFKYE